MTVVLILVKGVFICALFLLITLILEEAAAANFNQGIVVALFGFNAFPTALLFYCFYKEKLNWKHWLSILFLIVSVGLLAAGHEVDGESNGNDTALIIMVAALLILLMMFGFHSLVMRYLTATLGLSSFEVNLDAYLVTVIVLLTLNFVYV